MKIAIDAGHGPETPGKRSPDGMLREFHFNAAVAALLREQLLGYSGVEVLFTHSQSRDVPLAERTGLANQWGADLFLSIHANASGSGGWDSANGIETYVYLTRTAAAMELANDVQLALVQATGLANRGVKTADFHVLRETKMTAILVECGFMTNQREAELLKNAQFRATCAAAMAERIAIRYRLTQAHTDAEEEGEENQLAITRMEELEQKVRDLTGEVLLLTGQLEQMSGANLQKIPEWAKEAVDQVCTIGVLNNPDEGSYDFYRIITILHRLGLLG